MKFLSKKLTKSAIGSALLLGTSLAFAADHGLAAVQSDLTDNQLPAVLKLISGASYIIGVGLGVKAGLKFKENNETKGQVPLSTPIILSIVAVILLALPTFLVRSVETIFGTASNNTTLEGTSLVDIHGS